jgi:hypothetical protein
MSMRMLMDGDFDRYFDPSRTRGAFWVFQHVPKTAGSSLREEVVQALREFRPETNIHLDGTDTSIPWHARMDQAVSGFAGALRVGDYRFASGHLFARHVAALRAARPDARSFTLLRDPVRRFVSDYRYQRSAMNPDHETFRREVPTLEAFLALGWSADSMARHLLPPDLLRRGDAAAALDHLLDDFEFVGVQDDYAFSFAILRRLLGLRREPKVRQRSNPPTPDNPTEVPEALAARLEAAHRFDRALYDGVRLGLAGIAEGFRAWDASGQAEDPSN